MKMSFFSHANKTHFHNKGFALSFVLKVRFYTHFKSCHPLGVKKGFVKGEGLRLLRTNSSEQTFVENIRIFKLRLRVWGYPNNLIDQTLSEVIFSDRKKALKDNTRVQKEILPFVTQYNPSVPKLKTNFSGEMASYRITT